MAEERLGFVGIVMEDRASAQAVNEILSCFAHIIRGRMGVPDAQSGEAVIGLIVRGGNDQLGALTGRLGNLPGVQVKSALTASKKEC
ncbi:MAG: iron-only hydrogenase system regulator [Clostridiales bacterium]|nr:iron-only hydrogenase system regulator [Clostridiales bacterium]MDO4349186.1 iron-only hydrogenase system regulator [Eubacteriales bacterium]MDY4007700.1 TM1266 family iron-only hydrogenase system putative regulator [Candidatus Limiplasma sp.]